MVWIIGTDELLARYNAGERNFAGIELLRIVERDGIGSDAINGLEGADLEGINLRGANLEYANLEGTILMGADLTGCILYGAYLAKAILWEAQLYSANLSWADCSEADFEQAEMSCVNASHTSFWHAKSPILGHSVLDNANFEGVGSPHRAGICREGNLIWNTRMPDGTIQVGPQYGDGKGR